MARSGPMFWSFEGSTVWRRAMASFSAGGRALSGWFCQRISLVAERVLTNFELFLWGKEGRVWKSMEDWRQG